MVNRLDLCIINFIESIRTPFLNATMPICSFLGDHGLFWIVLGLVLVIVKATRKAGIITLLALLIGLVSGEFILKNVFCRLRPFMIFDFLDTIIKAPMSYSFPSGHTTSSFAAATSIALLGRKPAILAFSAASLIAFSRIYLSVHYLTDILGGIALGIASAFAARWIYKKADSKLGLEF